jgi:hypothetical protein
MGRLNSRLGYEIKRNELALANMLRNYEGRRQFARRYLSYIRYFTSVRPAH